MLINLFKVNIPLCLNAPLYFAANAASASATEYQGVLKRSSWLTFSRAIEDLTKNLENIFPFWMKICEKSNFGLQISNERLSLVCKKVANMIG